MKLHNVVPRENFKQFLNEEAGYIVEDDSYNFHYVLNGKVAEISEEEADQLEEAGEEIYAMCLKAIDKVIRDKRFEDFGIGPLQAQLITKSWNRRAENAGGEGRDPELYGRIDFCWDNSGRMKFYEFNGDTATTAYECSVVQWKVIEELMARKQIPQTSSQFNSLEEKVVERFRDIFNIHADGGRKNFHFTAQTSWDEDVLTTSYLESLANQAGWNTKYVDIEGIGVCEDKKDKHNYGKFFDLQDEQIDVLYKLVPWEHIFEGPFANYVGQDNVRFVEPPWRALMSNKMLSVVLWEMFPNHPLLLASYKTPEKLGDTYVEKPIFGRIGSGIRAHFNDQASNAKAQTEEDLMDYSKYPKIYQEYCPLPEVPGMPGWRYQTGIWIVGDGKVGGMDMRIDNQIVTGSDDMKFLPHFMTPHKKAANTRVFDL